MQITDKDIDQMILAWALISDPSEIVTFAEDYAGRMGWGTPTQLEQKGFWTMVINAHMRYTNEQQALREATPK